MSASPDPDDPIQTLQRVVVLATGGTIAGLRQHGGQPGYHAARLGIDAVMQAAGVSGLAGVQTEQLAQVDSKDMTHALWHALALRCATLLMQPDLAGIVITHGTDTMEETAWFLHRVLHAGKPVVLTGAMRPADAPDADGPANLHDALAVARHRSMGGVSAVMAGEVHGAHAVRKVHATSLRAFSSGARPLRARVTSGEIHDIEGPTAPGAHANTHDAAALPPAAQWPRVDIVVSHAGADGAICDACVQAGARGIVMATTGDNTLHEALEAAATRARAQGVVVVRARQVDGAGDDDRTSEAQGDKATAWTAPETATAPANVSPVKARIDLMLALMAAPAPAARSSPGASR